VDVYDLIYENAERRPRKRRFHSIEKLLSFTRNINVKNKFWFDFQGSPKEFTKLTKYLNIHKLTIEDIVQVSELGFKEKIEFFKSGVGKFKINIFLSS